MLSIFIVSCNDNYSFYSSYQIDDLWRIPLIQPYELNNVAGAKPEDFGNDNWHLVFTKLKDGRFNSGVNVTMINVKKGVIYGYGTANPCQHFLIECAKENERIFPNKEEWQKELFKLSIDCNELYDAFDVFEKFKDSKKLPWVIAN